MLKPLLKKLMLVFVLGLTSQAMLAAPANIPVKDFFKDPEYSGLQLSPNGKYLAVLSPINDRRNIVVMDVDGLKNPRPLTGLKKQGIANFFWANNDDLVFTMDSHGNEAFSLFVVNREGAPKIKELVGSSAGIMAVLVGLATKIPTYEIRFNLIGGVKLWIIAAIYVGVSLVGLDGLNSGGNIAHLGGALLGFFYTKQLQGGSDIGRFFEKFLNSIVSVFQSKKQNPLKTVHKKKNIKRKPTYKEQNVHQQKIDGILDKISKSGYESLTKEEKDFLFKAGKK